MASLNITPEQAQTLRMPAAVRWYAKQRQRILTTGDHVIKTPDGPQKKKIWKYIAEIRKAGAAIIEYSRRDHCYYMYFDENSDAPAAHFAATLPAEIRAAYPKFTATTYNTIYARLKRDPDIDDYENLLISALDAARAGEVKPMNIQNFAISYISQQLDHPAGSATRRNPKDSSDNWETLMQQAKEKIKGEST